MRSAPKLKEIFAPFFKYPLLFLGAQSIQGVLSLMESIVEPRFSQKNPVMLVALFFPPYVITTTLSTALTFYLVRDYRMGKVPSLASAIQGVKEKFWQLVLCSFVLGLIYILGFCAFVIPVVYFMAIYLFVPYFILIDEKAPFSAYLFRSTQLAKKNLTLSIMTVVGILLVGLLTFAVSRFVTDKMNSAVASEQIQLVVSFMIDFALTLVTGSWIDTWVASYFLNLKEDAHV